MKELLKYLNKEITLWDKRTGTSYKETVTDVRMSYGKLQMQIDGENPIWFEPTTDELASVKP